MSDILSLALNTDLLTNAVSFKPTAKPISAELSTPKTPTAPVAENSAQSANNSNDQGIYAVKGDSLYKEEMDLNTDGTITNAELADYYAKVAAAYGETPSLPSEPTGNVVTQAQAANAYAANEAAFSAAFTSLINTSA